MAYTTGLCNKIQTNILRVFGPNAPARKRRKLGFLQFIRSAYNTTGFEQLQPNGGIPGKRRGIIMKYRDAYCFDTAKVARDCVNNYDAEPIPLETTYDVGANPYQPVDGSNRPLNLLFDDDEMAKLCEGNAEWFTDNVIDWIARMTENIDKALLAEMASKFGKFADGSTEKSVPLYANVGAINQPLRTATNKIITEFDDILAFGTPVIVGNGNIVNYNRDLNNACCNNYGVNMATNGLWYLFQDQYAESIWGDDRFGVFSPGAVQLVTWSRYKGREKDNDIFSQGVITDPVTGLEFDIKVIYDYNCEKWRVKLYLYADLITASGTACDLDDVNNTLLFRGCAEEQEFDCPPEG